MVAALDKMSHQQHEEDQMQMEMQTEVVSSSSRSETQWDPRQVELDVTVPLKQLNRRLSEGSIGGVGLTRKNSGQLLSELDKLPSVTEGEPMSSFPESNFDLSSGFSKQTPSQLLRSLDLETNQSSNSLDKSSTSPSRSSGRRRSSTVSQCSSVLSETARNQLQFDLAPDLPQDSSLLETNALLLGAIEQDQGGCPASRASNFERPNSPEPEIGEDELQEDDEELDGISISDFDDTLDPEEQLQLLEQLELDTQALNSAHLRKRLQLRRLSLQQQRLMSLKTPTPPITGERATSP